jgi:hypothetical protein
MYACIVLLVSEGVVRKSPWRMFVCPRQGCLRPWRRTRAGWELVADDAEADAEVEPEAIARLILIALRRRVDDACE